MGSARSGQREGSNSGYMVSTPATSFAYVMFPSNPPSYHAHSITCTLHGNRCSRALVTLSSLSRVTHSLITHHHHSSSTGPHHHSISTGSSYGESIVLPPALSPTHLYLYISLLSLAQRSLERGRPRVCTNHPRSRPYTLRGVHRRRRATTYTILSLSICVCLSCFLYI